MTSLLSLHFLAIWTTGFLLGTSWSKPPLRVMSASFHVLRTLTCSLQLFAANNTLPHSLRHSFARSLSLSLSNDDDADIRRLANFLWLRLSTRVSKSSFVRSFAGEFAPLRRLNRLQQTHWCTFGLHSFSRFSVLLLSLCVCVCLQFSRPGLTTSAFTLPATSLASVCLFSVYIRYCTFGLDLQQPPLCTHVCALFYVQRALVLYVTYTNNFQRWIELGCV